MSKDESCTSEEYKSKDASYTSERNTCPKINHTPQRGIMSKTNSMYNYKQFSCQTTDDSYYQKYRRRLTVIK